MEPNAIRIAAVIASLSCCVGWATAADTVNHGGELKPATLERSNNLTPSWGL